MSKTFDYYAGDTHVYVETCDNGDELVSEYGKGWQKAYVRTKAQLDYWKEAERERSKVSDHTVGSHSDDRGGDSDFPCYCEYKAVWATRNPAAERTDSLPRASSQELKGKG